ncbi:MAG: transposase, partial [Halopseudomonas sp.]|uniref:transposase n=1 Tax=Halopseudomonas sp. TaxID=2901191 RepID=UPI0030016578
RHNDYTSPLRRVTVQRPDKSTPIILATNDLESPAVLIAQRYKERWAIELYFKWIKQHLKIKTFFGRSENAVKIQILCALIAYLLLVIYRKENRLKGSLWTILAELRVTLFQRPMTEENSHRRWQNERIEREKLQFGLFS